MAEFEFYRPPREVQGRDFARFKDDPYHALFYEPRCGKTKVELDLFRYRYLLGPDDPRYVDALIVVAFPSGVPQVWIDELPKDLPPEFLKQSRWLRWESGKTSVTKQRKEEALDLRAHPGPIVVAMNCEALNSDAGFKYLRWLLAKRKVMFVADEASWAANYSSRTKKLLALSGTLRSNTKPHPNLILKAILDGTPVEEGPEEIYYPAQFLKFGLLGFTSKTVFRNRYVSYEMEDDPENPGQRRRKERERFIRWDHVNNEAITQKFPVQTGYQNLDELHARMMSFGSRVKRSDLSDAPEKIFQTRYFALTAKQRKVYDDLRDTYKAELGNGIEVTADNVLLRMTRLQMVGRNFYPPETRSEPCPGCMGFGYLETGDRCEPCQGLGVKFERTGLVRIDETNPAAEALAQELKASAGNPFVVWCRFQQDVIDAAEACERAGARVFQYYGAVSARERELAYQGFKSGERDGIVATILSGLQRGKDCSRARLLVYYSNEWSLRARRQSEDRAEGVDRLVSTDVVDLAAQDTRDLDAINALREKRSLAELVMGDNPTRWL